ncbi:hypothetical protein LVT70_01180 [Klebsiella pneumoniae]|nr:hypothetical protein [Klebsiella pneumoniae]
MARIRKDEPIPLDGRKIIAERNRADRRYAQKRKDIDKYNSVSEETRKLYHDIQRRNLYANMTVELNEEICTMPSGFLAFRTQQKKGIEEAQEYLRSVGIDRKEKETDFDSMRKEREFNLHAENVALLKSRSIDPFTSNRLVTVKKRSIRQLTKKPDVIKEDKTITKVEKIFDNLSDAEMEVLFNLYNQKKLSKDGK